MHQQTSPDDAGHRLTSDLEASAEGPDLLARIRAVQQQGREIEARITEARGDRWHSFVPANYDDVLEALLGIRDRGGRFLELGSGIGVITIMADLLGFEARGIEIEPELVERGRGLATSHQSGARFAAGSYLPADYVWASESGDRRMGSMGIGAPAYEELGYELADHDWIYAFPWPGEAEIIRDLVRRLASPEAKLMLNGAPHRPGFHAVT